MSIKVIHNHAHRERGVLLRALASLAAALMVATVLVATAPANSAAGISGSEFNPGYIISDSEFYNANAMSESEIQAFLDSKIGSCQSDRDRCLNVLVHTMPNKNKDTICEAMQGGTALKASTIIYRTQVACGISAKVILVTLEKEQGLTTSRNPGKAALDRAMGYACPDTSPCAVYALGFGNQVYRGARQLMIYKADNFGMQPGYHSIQYKPFTSCGTLRINIQNYATAALYNYTPYVPNRAALNNLRGYGDSCSSYGNRNFWYLYYSWFGNPVEIRPTAAIHRVGGPDRYYVSAKLSAENYPTAGVPVLYVATGTTFPDALGAASAAATQGGPLLLVKPGSIPESVYNQIVRLKPLKIVVAGGPGSVSESVYNQLAGMTPEIRRESGIDRYEASRNIARGAFPAGTTTTAYIATGKTFPDALSASAAAASVDAPVILVKGFERSLDADTRQLLVDLGVTNVKIAGGPGSVSNEIEVELKGLLGASQVVRHGGADRYVVSGSINRAAFDAVDTVYVASGHTFPDALAGAAIAGAKNAPLYVVRSNCLPKYVLQDIVDSGASKVVILGGTGTLTVAVEKYANCA